MLIGRFESVLPASVPDVSPSAFAASSATFTMGVSSVWGTLPTGRMPIVSNFTVILSFARVHRAFSAATPLAIASWIAWSIFSRLSTDSERMSISIAASGEIVFTDVPPFTMPTLNVVLMPAGGCRSPMLAMARPMA